MEAGPLIGGLGRVGAQKRSSFRHIPAVLIARAGRKQKGWEPRGAHPLHNVVAMLLCLLGHPVAAKDAAQTEADLCIVFLRRRCIR
jgi:hypothetical protein